MAVQRFFDKEISLVKEKLINTSLVVSFIAGIPLLLFSIIRSLQFNQYLFVIINSVVFVTLFFLTIFRRKIKYFYKALYVIILTIILAVTDYINVGVLSTGYMWCTVGAILAFLYFDLRASIITMFVALIVTFIFGILIHGGFISYNFDFNKYAYSEIVMLIRTLMFLLTVMVVVFSIRQITRKFDINLERLSLQRQNLMNNAIQMKKEIAYRKISEQTALENELKFRNIFESSTDPIVIVSMDGNFQDHNKAFLDLVNRSEEELQSVDFLDVVPENYAKFYQGLIGNLDKVPPRYDLKYVSKRTGETKYLDVTSTVIDYKGGEAVLAIFRDNTEKINQERSIYSAALEGEERERLRLSKELHDGLGPLLSTLKIYYEALEKRPDDIEIQNRIKAILNDSISSVKEISNNLSPYILQNLGVTKALKAFIDKIVFAGKLEIDFSSNIEVRLDEKTEITVYRLVTEMLNNTLKHAKARVVRIELSQNNGILTVNYSDDGIGFDQEKLQIVTKGIGLFNMKSRIEKMGGTCEFISAPGEGFKMNARINWTT